MYVLDTNTLIYYLKDIEAVFPFVEAEGNVAISVISKIELLGKKTLDEKEIIRIKEFLKSFVIVEVGNVIAEKAISFRIEGLKIGDAIIAATASHFHLPLVTRDASFRKVRGIKVINPFSS